MDAARAARYCFRVAVQRPKPEENLVCRCYQVYESEIRKAIEGGKLTTVEQVTAATNAAGGCSSCYDDVQVILNRMNGVADVKATEDQLSDSEKRTVILQMIEQLITPLYTRNEVELHVLGVEGDRVFARFKGPTVGTTLPSILTLKWFLVKMMSNACGRKMQLVELNMMESHE